MCSGKDTILQHEEPSSSMPTRGAASIAQLSYSACIPSFLCRRNPATCSRNPAQVLEQIISKTAGCLLHPWAAVVTCIGPSAKPTTGLKALSCTCACAGKPDVAHKSVQQHLWTGLKATDLHMPACPQRSAVVAAHQQQLQKEAAESQWATTSRTVAEIASQGAVGGACKREGCRWVLCIVITREATRSLGP